MKELIEAVIFSISILGAGTYAVREVHDTVRKAAIEKVGHGLPSLTKITKTLRGVK